MAEACYKPKYVPASFKGVPFDALDVSSEHGRRGAEGEFPFGETTDYVDMGRKIRRYPISGRFAKNSHIADAAALIAAVESPGPGLLLHPTRGALTVACSSLRVSDNPNERQGETTFDAEFVEANISFAGFQFGGNLGGIDLVNIIDAVNVFFVDKYIPDAVRWYQSAQVAASAEDVVSQISTQYQKATSQKQDRTVYQLLNSFNTVVNDPFTIRDPKLFFRVLTNGFSYLDAATQAETKVSAFKALVNWAAKSSALSGEAAEAQNAIYTAVRLLATGYAVRGLLETKTTTLNAALKDFDMISGVLREELEIINTECYSPRLYLRVLDFLIEIQTRLLNRAYELPALVEYKFSGGVHFLVAAYEIFDDAKRFAEIESRNPQYLPWAAGPTIVASRKI